MSDIKTKRVDIYPYNVVKSDELTKALGMSHAEMVNYLIECADIQQLTKITFENKQTKKSFSTIKASGSYDPKNWR
jgi:hypothetical protein